VGNLGAGKFALGHKMQFDLISLNQDNQITSQSDDLSITYKNTASYALK
jgi:hypothetical protein